MVTQKKKTERQIKQLWQIKCKHMKNAKRAKPFMFQTNEHTHGDNDINNNKLTNEMGIKIGDPSTLKVSNERKKIDAKLGGKVACK